MKQLLLFAVAFAAVECSKRVKFDDQPELTIDRTQPFWLELIRGGIYQGRDRIKLDPTGRVVLRRFKTERKQNGLMRSPEVATLQLSPEAVDEILDAVEWNDLTGLHKAYIDEGVYDGTQWLLRITQGDREKSVYCSNYFPPQIKRFAKQLDSILAQAGLETVTWQPAPKQDSGQFEQDQWISNSEAESDADADTDGSPGF